MKDKGKAPQFFLTTCVFQMFSETFFYVGCPSCKKKIVPSEAKGHCANCQADFEEPMHIYSFSVLLADGSERLWAQVFGPNGESIFGSLPSFILP